MDSGHYYNYDIILCKNENEQIALHRLHFDPDPTENEKLPYHPHRIIFYNWLLPPNEYESYKCLGIGEYKFYFDNEIMIIGIIKNGEILAWDRPPGVLEISLINNLAGYIVPSPYHINIEAGKEYYVDFYSKGATTPFSFNISEEPLFDLNK